MKRYIFNRIFIISLCASLFVMQSYAQTSGEVPAIQEKANEVGKGIKQKEHGWLHGSVMYDAKVINWLKKAIESHEESIPLEILLPSLFKSQKKDIKQIIEEVEEQPASGVDEENDLDIKPNVPNQINDLDEDGVNIDENEDSIETVDAPSFYLRSILYINPSNWSVWVNDQKISQDIGDYDEYLKIVRVQEDKAIFLWKQNNIDTLHPSWREDFPSLAGDGRFVSNNENIVIDLDTTNIAFVLRANQSMVSSQMKILEGKIESSSVDVRDSIDEREEEYFEDGDNIIEGDELNSYKDSFSPLIKKDAKKNIRILNVLKEVLKRE